MSSSNYVDWPTCAECSDRRKHTHPFEDPWCPVEEYGVDVDNTPNILLASYTIRVVVTARCSHGHGPDGWESRARRQTSEPIDCPIWWNVDREQPLKSHYLRQAIRSLTFFRASEARPTHRMVTLVH